MLESFSLHYSLDEWKHIQRYKTNLCVPGVVYM